MADVYFWRQVFVLCGTLLHSVCVGIILAFPAVLNPAITSSSSTEIKTSNASWIASINGVGGLFGSILLALIMQTMGRKACIISSNVFYLVGWIIFPLAEDIVALYAARFIQGISVGSPYIISIIISEYVHPSRRGYFITLNKVMLAVGILWCHAMSAIWTWRLIAAVAAIPTLLTTIWTFFWPESPSHLALKGRFSECEVSFKWLNGNSEESMRNLKSMIETQKEKLEKNNNNNSSLIDSTKKTLKKDFKRATLISTLLILAVDLCGRYYMTAYVIQIMMELLDNHNSALYFTLGVDLFTVTAVAMATVIIRYVKRRAILVYSGLSAVFFMLLVSILVYLRTVSLFSTYALWFTALMIVFQCFISNIGLIPVSFALISEIFPLEQKSSGMFVSGFMFTSLCFLVLKGTPVLIEETGLHGTYAIYGIALAICIISLYNIVPETKDKTLQEIENEMNSLQARI